MARIKLADYGRTICQVCDGRLDDGRPTSEMEGTQRGYGTSPSGKTYLREDRVTRKIHTACLVADEDRRQAAMRAAMVQNMTDLYQAYRDGGMSVDAIVAGMRKADLTDAEIKQIMGADR